MNKVEFMNLYNKCAKHVKEEFGYDLSDWEIEFSKQMTRTAGYCNYSSQLFKFSTLFVFSQPEEEIQKVILHEMAHAATPGHKHDKIWTQMCISFGGDGQRYLMSNSFREFACKLRLDCFNCGMVYFDNRDKSLFAGAMCTKCHSKVVLIDNPKYYKNTKCADFVF